ncbi:MAG: glutathione S-transferase family protein [Polyangiaceae bacterium]|jgi:glutathione S-transferase
MAKLTLFSARACPFAHRTRLVLSHKGVDFELREIDLRNKPAWFSSVSGYGKVPAIEHDGNRIWESAVINEYLDEVFPSPPLLPDGPARRAVARLWIDWANTRFVTAFGALLRGSTEALRDAARSELRTALEFLDREGFAKASADGPYFFGPAPSLVDFTLYPWFERWPALEQLRGSVLARPIDRLKRYSEQIAKLPAVKIEQNPTSYYVERYAVHVRSDDAARPARAN